MNFETLNDDYLLKRSLNRASPEISIGKWRRDTHQEEKKRSLNFSYSWWEEIYQQQKVMTKKILTKSDQFEEGHIFIVLEIFGKSLLVQNCYPLHLIDSIFRLVLHKANKTAPQNPTLSKVKKFWCVKNNFSTVRPTFIGKSSLDPHEFQF